MPLVALLTTFFGTIFSRLSILFLTLVPWIVAKVITLLGVSFLTFNGFTTLFDNVSDRLYSMIGGLPADLLQLVLLFGIDDCIAIFLASWVAGSTLKALASFRRLTFGAPTV